MTSLIIMTAMYMFFMYFATIFIYKRKKIEITRLEIITRTVFSGVVFFILMYFLGKM